MTHASAPPARINETCNAHRFGRLGEFVAKTSEVWGTADDLRLLEQLR